VQVETCADMPLLQSSHMAPFNYQNKIIQGTSEPRHVHLTTLCKMLIIG